MSIEGKEVKDFMKIEQVAELIQCSKVTVYRLIESGRLKCYRFGNAKNSPVRISREQIMAFLEGAK